MKTQKSILRGLFGIYVAQYILNKSEIVKMSDFDLIRFVHQMMF